MDEATTGGTAARFADATLRRLHDALADRYELLRELGRGGMATVYVARDRKHDREVALKVMDPALARGVGATRFLREVRIAATLTHPGIVPVFDSGEVDDTFYYVMPLLRGSSLRERMRQGPIAAREACLMLAEVADALDAAHRASVVHRDVKPENVLLLDGRPLVTDFGVAHAAQTFAESLTETGAAVGTVLYMAPEQLFGTAGIDGRADVFSVGAILYEILSGAPPFSAPTTPAAMARLASSPTPALPQSLPVSDAVRVVVARATARERDDRFPTAHELAEALREAAVTPALGGSPRAVRARSHRGWRLPAALAAVAAAITLTVAYAHTSGRTSRGTDSPPAHPSLAVLSFANSSGDAKLAYFSDGIAQELQSALGEVNGLSVSSRTAVDAWRGKSADPREIARALSVTELLEGSVARTEDSVRIYVRLVDGSTGRQRWSGKFDRKLADVFDVQEEVARAVVRELRVALAPTSVAIVRSRTASLEAHDLVLRANYDGRSGNRPDLERSVSLADSAIALDSTYAPAWASRARMLTLLSIFRDRTSPEVLREARESAARAVALDSLSAEAQASFGILLFRYDWNWAEAERHLRRAIALNPTFLDAHASLARVLRSLGRFDEARLHQTVVNRIDPDRRSSGMAFGRISFFARDYDRAIRETEAQGDPGQRAYTTFLGEAYLESGRLAKAESLLTRDTSGVGRESSLARVLVATGRGALARRAAVDAERMNRWSLEAIAEVYVALGDRAHALDLLERAVAEHDAFVVDFLVRPGLDPIRGEPRFQALMRRLAFPAPARFER